MKGDSIKILLVEDSPSDARLVTESLRDAWASRFQLEHVESLTEAVQLINSRHFDVILLDLMLPDSQGLDTVTQTHNHAPQVPIIVLTGVGDEEIGLKAVQSGAQDYLAKDQVAGELLSRTISYSIERVKLLVELEEIRLREQHERELRSLERISRSPEGESALGTTALGAVPLRDENPEKFEALVDQYAALIGEALDDSLLGVERIVAEGLRNIGEELGSLKASQYDVVHLHTAAIRRKTETTRPQETQVIVEQGRQIVLELMGYVLSYYRDSSLAE